MIKNWSFFDEKQRADYFAGVMSRAPGSFTRYLEDLDEKEANELLQWLDNEEYADLAIMSLLTERWPDEPVPDSDPNNGQP